MIKTNFTQLKIINILILSTFFLACSTLKNDRLETNNMSNYIDDFIDNYSLNVQDDSLKGIIIHGKVDSSNESFVIMDAPINVISGALNEKDSKYKVGIYKGVFCQYLPEDMKNSLFKFKDIDKNDLAKINKNQTLKIGDKDLTLNNAYINWESNIEITYNLKKNTKEIKILGNSTSVIVRGNVPN